MNKKTILIVDDDTGFRKTLSDILKAKGYVPMAVETGKQALGIRRGAVARAWACPRCMGLSSRIAAMSGLTAS